MASNLSGGRFRTVISAHQNARCRRCARPIPRTLLAWHLGQCKGKGKRAKGKEDDVKQDLDTLIRDALRKHAAAHYEAGDPDLSPWPDDPDGSLLRLSNALTTMLDCWQEMELLTPVNVHIIPDAMRTRLAIALELVPHTATTKAES